MSDIKYFHVSQTHKTTRVNHSPIIISSLQHTGQGKRLGHYMYYSPKNIFLKIPFLLLLLPILAPV